MVPSDFEGARTASHRLNYGVLASKADLCRAFNHATVVPIVL